MLESTIAPDDDPTLCIQRTQRFHNDVLVSVLDREVERDCVGLVYPFLRSRCEEAVRLAVDPEIVSMKCRRIASPTWGSVGFAKSDVILLDPRIRYVLSRHLRTFDVL
jgi:hypothetical protein